MKANISSENRGIADPLKLNDCWNKIGVWGDRECLELKKVVHCRNCVVYSSAAAQLLGAELPEDYLERWTTHFSTELKAESRQRQAALLFRVGAEWLALSPMHLQEVAERRPTHSVPQGRSISDLGLANSRGELLVCIALDRLLEIKKI